MNLLKQTSNKYLIFMKKTVSRLLVAAYNRGRPALPDITNNMRHSKMSFEEPVLISINTTCEVMGIGRTYLYSLINDGKLETVKLGRRTLIKMSSIYALIEGCEAA